jgi:hypothetical protein
MWLALVSMMFSASAGPSAASSASDYIKVEVCGTLRAGIMAIGGETTGVVINARGATWELDLGKAPGAMAKAMSLDGRKVVVKGTLEVRPGVERRERAIVTVTSLEPAPSAAP